MINSINKFAHTPNFKDALSDVLGLIRFTGGYIEVHTSGSMSDISLNTSEPSLLIIKSGTFYFRCEDYSPDPIELSEGDILLTFSSEFSISYPHKLIESEWLRGTFQYDQRLSKRLLYCLPKVIVIRRVTYGVMDWLETASQFALNEIETNEPGSTIMISRIMELLLIRVLRLWALEPNIKANWLSGAADPAIGYVLGAMHSKPEKAWTVCELANLAGLSRSVFASRFVALVGEPPFRYLIGLRLDKAAELLQQTKRTIFQVAEDTGYASEAAFSRAFKQRFGSSPSYWRQQ
ncbi:AraC family transcriptional regulator [Acinetobacter stercoris]|uniref:HTH-type transcriptional regulator CdhR n=1 Tax=Acinetobacter stercoris TaxID=2126983 RepID=A0A2U3N3B8_9GAMM|nr:helix-turn-helix domain-containing protein [Acinetobacter stercoris]SPL72105.1 HTH-type transcriptional regulator CdhR [Acinetobacter stercoris]